MTILWRPKTCASKLLHYVAANAACIFRRQHYSQYDYVSVSRFAIYRIYHLCL